MDTPPPGLIGWLQSLFWFAGFIAAMVGLVKMLRRKEPEPANESLGQSVQQMAAAHKETRARVIALEEWRYALTQKMDADKNEILKAGEDRKDELQKQINALPGKIVADILNAKKLFNT